MNAANFSHVTVLLHEAVAALAVRPDGCYLDGTSVVAATGREVLRALGESGRLLGFDKDPLAIASRLALAAEDARSRSSSAASPNWARSWRRAA